MNQATAIQYIPLDKLRLSPKNVRKQRDPEAVEQMAASILAHGLLQNLGVEPSANDDGTFDVITGGTRLAALQQLAKAGAGSQQDVPCRLITNGETIEASAAENLVRTRLSPADEFDAFKAMADSGRSRAEIAQHFGVPEITVARSLKLANVDPQLFRIFREGGMELDQLQALAVTDDHKAQHDAWFGVKHDYERYPYQLRERLTQRNIRSDSPLPLFVGLDAYEAAGGTVMRDLFSERGHVYLGDRALLESLAMDKLDAIAKELVQAGWSWAEPHLSLDFAQQSQYPVGWRDTEITVTEYLPDDLQVQLDAIEQSLQVIEDTDADDLDEDAAAALEEEQQELFEREGTIRQQMRQRWPEEIMRQSGVLVFLTHDGLEMAYARLRPGQHADAAGNVTGKAKPTKPEKGKDKPKTATLSHDMVDRLRLHKEAAVRVAIADDTSGALEMLLASLLAQLLTNGSSGPFDLRVTNAHRAELDRSKRFEDLPGCKARASMDTLLDALRKDGLPKKSSDIQPWLATRTVDQLHHIIAIVAALAFDPSPAALDALAKSYDIDMAQWWQPGPTTYLSHIPKALMVEAAAEVAGKEAAAKAAALKKDAAIAECAKLLAGSGWLPKPLRGAGYALAKPGRAAAPAKPAPGKKPAAKKTPARKAPAKKAAKQSGKKPAKKAKP